MQTLYNLATAEDEAGKSDLNPDRLLTEKLERSLDLFTLAVLYTIAVAQYAETDARLRSSKYLPSAEDLVVSTRIAGNDFALSVLANETFASRVKDRHLGHQVDDAQVKKIYGALIKTPEYQQYISNEAGSGDEKTIIRFIWKNLLDGAQGQEFFHDEVSGWEDDCDMIRMLMDNFFKTPQHTNFLVLLSPEKKEYAYDLLQATLDKADHIMKLIEPKLQNWDAERVAMIDLILLRMGVCELLYFPTIPTKVTINEYIEVAKQYSTPQSGHFVNGILDALLKDLVREGVVSKAERYVKNNGK